MLQCHSSYSACGLGSDGTDKLVGLVQEMQHSKAAKSNNGTLFWAKITGDGSGGTVCVVGRNCLASSEQILEVAFHPFSAFICSFNLIMHTAVMLLYVLELHFKELS